MKLSEKKQINYKAIYFLGVSLIGTGTVFVAAINPAFISILGMGVVLMIIGLINRDKWERSAKKN